MRLLALAALFATADAFAISTNRLVAAPRRSAPAAALSMRYGELRGELRREGPSTRPNVCARGRGMALCELGQKSAESVATTSSSRPAGPAGKKQQRIRSAVKQHIKTASEVEDLASILAWEEYELCNRRMAGHVYKKVRKECAKYRRRAAHHRSRRRRGRDVDLSLVNRGDAAAARWKVRGDESRRGRGRGRDVDSPWRRVAAATRPRRGYSEGHASGSATR